MMRGDVKICAHPYAYTKLREDHDLYAQADLIFADFEKAGLDGIELMHTMLEADEAVERLGALSAQHDMPIIGTSFGMNMWDVTQSAEVLERGERVLDQVQALGGYQMGTSTGSAGDKKTPEQLDTQAETLRRMIALAEERGVTLNLHNHTYEVLYGEHEVNTNIARIPEVKLGPDLNWLRRGGIDALDFLRRHADRIVFMHLRDQKGERWTEAVGEGDEDYGALADVIDEIDFRGAVAIELAHEPDQEFSRPMGENFALSAAHLRRAFGGEG
jgi:sugar phosphate isomerase/epimerase